MKLNAQLDVDVLALQQDDEVTCLLTLEAPALADEATRPGETVIVVVDRSGSMHGAPLQAVRSSLHTLADRMKPQDTLGVVAFDEQATIQLPARTMGDHDLYSVHEAIEYLQPGGNTDLSAGYLLGLAEAGRHRGTTGATVLLLSDGHANAGILDAPTLGRLAESAFADRTTTTTIGIGGGYDETLLAHLATKGNGAHRFAYTPDDAAAVLAEEAGDLLTKSIVNAFARITPTDPAHLERIGLLHDVPRWVEQVPRQPDRIVVPLGDLYSRQVRELLVHFAVPAIAQLGAATLATITIDYVALPTLTAQSIQWPVNVNVIPGDEAASRIPNPTVRTARLLAEATEAKRQASDALQRGDTTEAARLMTEQSALVGDAASRVPDGPGADAIRARLAEEQAQLERLARAAKEQDIVLSNKSFIEDIQAEALGANDQAQRMRRRNKRDF